MPKLEECEGNLTGSAGTRVADVLALSVAAPLQLWLAVWFLRKMIASRVDLRSRMNLSVVLYTLLSTVTLMLGFYNSIIEPMRQVVLPPSLIACQITSFMRWTFGSLCYVLIVLIFLMRVDDAFRGSPMAVSASVRRGFLFTLLCISLNSLITYSIFASKLQCWQHYSLGFLSRSTPLFPKSVRFCSVDPKDEWLRRVAAVPGGVVFGFSSVTLVWMFVHRLRSLDENESTNPFNTIAEKSMVLALIGFVTTMTSLMSIVLTGLLLLARLDLMLNTVLLICMYSFGDDLYRKWFGGIATWLRWIWAVRKGQSVMHAIQANEEGTDKDTGVDPVELQPTPSQGYRYRVGSITAE